MKNIITTAILATVPFLLQAQSIAVQQKMFATTEKELYKIYEQMLDSAITLKSSLIGSYFRPIENKDTLMKFEQYCYWHVDGDYMCERDHYRSYISNSMSITFYERFLDYLKELWKNDNLFYKHHSMYPLYDIKGILIKRYESGILTKKENLKALELIEQTTLRIVNDAHSYNFLYGDNKYMTENIRQALVNVIEYPFYPESYLDFYLKEVVDTMVLDTTGIPIEIIRERKKWRGLYVSGNLDYDLRLARFDTYKRMGDELGLSPGQAYLEEKKKAFPEKGYLDINVIADYAYKNQDSLIIGHLKEFKKKYPDYPLRHF